MRQAAGSPPSAPYRSRFTEGLLLEHLYHWERTRPGAVTLVQPLGGGKVRELTFRQALDEVRRMAAHLTGLGLPPGSAIGLLGRNSAHWLLADCAIWMAGHVSVPIFPTVRAASMEYVLRHAEVKLLLVGKLDEWEGMKAGVDPQLPRLRLPLAPAVVGGETWDEVVARTSPLPGFPTRGADEVATIVYTSGSTGQAKGVMHTFGSMTRALIAQDRVLLEAGLATSPETRLFSYLPLAHVYERVVVEASWLGCGGVVYFADSLATFVEDLQRARPTMFHSVPRLWQQFYLAVSTKLPPARLDRLLGLPVVSFLVKRRILKGLGLDQVKLALSASAPIAPTLLEWYRRLGLELLEGYGMSEDFACSHFSPPRGGRSGYVGYPLPGVACRLSPEGEVEVKSPGAMLGYFKDPEGTRAAFTADGFFRTGDRGEHDQAGRLRITGRVKELFKTSKGKYVAPVPIENRLLEDPRLEAACVSGVGQPQPFALVMLSPSARAEAAGPGRPALEAALRELLDRVNAGLDLHETLEFLAVVAEPWTIENGLLTPTLKFRRQRIEERYQGQVEGWYRAQVPVVFE